MIISKKEQNDFKNAKSCHICNKEYTNELFQWETIVM